MVALPSDYRIFETERFQKDLKAISAGSDRAVLEKLRAFAPETWRYRIGRWRFFYEVDDEEGIVFMTAASHRGSAY